MTDIEDFLVEVSEFLDNQADADCVGDPPRYVPNRAMTLYMQAEELLSQYEKARKVPAK